MLLIYSEHIMAFGKKVAFKQRGYVICKDIKCMNENLQICNKAYWNDFTGSSWAESFVEGHDNDDCIFITKRSNKVKTTCSFGKDIFSKELVDEVFGVHKGLEKVVAENCKQTLTK